MNRSSLLLDTVADLLGAETSQTPEASTASPRSLLDIARHACTHRGRTARWNYTATAFGARRPARRGDQDEFL